MVRSESETSIIYLMGMPGCGKTTLGKKLAKSLNYSFIDMDNYIEEIEGESIPHIFNSKGENYFRRIEQSAVKDSKRWQNTVVACGGGAPCFFDNMEVMKNSGLTIFVDVSTNELLKRIYGKGQHNRPLVANKSKEELFNELQTKLDMRLKYFSSAHLILKSDAATHLDLLDQIQDSKK